MTGFDLEHTPPTTRRPRLIVVGYSLPDRSSHYFNELLGYKTAAEALGFSPKILVPRTADPGLAALLSANAVLGPKPALAGFGATDVASTLDSFLDATENLEVLWDSIQDQDLCSTDVILFPEENPILIRGVGLWLARRSPDQRPAIFFRFIGSLLDARTGKPTPHTSFYRLASRDLRTRSGHQRVFFLVNNALMARVVTRVCCRRAFLMPMPKYLGDEYLGDEYLGDEYLGDEFLGDEYLGDTPESREPTQPLQPTIYVHLNERSGRLLNELSALFRPVLQFDPSVSFLVKFTRNCAERAPVFDPDIASAVEVLSAEQDTAAYLTNYSRCTLVLLAYEPEGYTTITSGVFSEAASFGKPVVVPSGTTMELQLAAGHGVGTVFEAAVPKLVAAALIEALQSTARLGAAARALAPRARTENTCLRFVERMLALARNEEDPEPRYHVGEPIDFSNYFDSRCFMLDGWGVTEDWGVWTVGPRAELKLLLDEAAPDQQLVLNVVAQAFLTPTHRRSQIRVSAAGQMIADWIFEFDGLRSYRPRPCEAIIPARKSHGGRALEISFAIETPMSPLALGLSTDKRDLGLGLCKLSISPATGLSGITGARDRPACRAQEKRRVSTVAGALIGGAAGIIAGFGIGLVLSGSLRTLYAPVEFDGWSGMALTFFLVVLMAIIGGGFGCFFGFRIARRRRR